MGEGKGILGVGVGGGGGGLREAVVAYSSCYIPFSSTQVLFFMTTPVPKLEALTFSCNTKKMPVYLAVTFLFSWEAGIKRFLGGYLVSLVGIQ